MQDRKHAKEASSKAHHAKFEAAKDGEFHSISGLSAIPTREQDLKRVGAKCGVEDTNSLEVPATVATDSTLIRKSDGTTTTSTCRLYALAKDGVEHEHSWEFVGSDRDQGSLARLFQVVRQKFCSVLHFSRSATVTVKLQKLTTMEAECALMSITRAVVHGVHACMRGRYWT
mmetsp:Transcript_19988/g.38734  ORF Transcript_19988/g.38734 Transcript_19988/m.38734 type:complete len:172 (-) Transcript_19988:85-600(-)